MHRYKLVISIVYFFISSCSESNIAKIVTEKSLENIISEDFLRNPSQMKATGNGKMVIIDEFGIHGFIKVLDQDWKVLHSLGKLGEGPDEFSSYPSLSIGDDGQVYVFDGFRNKLFSLDLEEGSLLQEQFLIPESDIVEEIIAVSETEYIFQPGGYQTLFTKMAREVRGAKSSFSLSVKNAHFQGLDNTRKLTFSSNYLTKKPSEERYAAVFNYYDELLITDGKQTKFHETLFGDLLYDADQTNIAFTAIASTDQNIYAVYYGKNVTELENPSQCNLLVFDWSGKLKENIALDHPLNFITIDEANGIMYGFNPMNEDNPIYKLKLE
ncbi:BF3164 family lipoprotein [Belliella pelovolcani]|nr:BF3164 family lipoprotein [Belliella pelovolcani]